MFLNRNRLDTFCTLHHNKIFFISFIFINFFSPSADPPFFSITQFGLGPKTPKNNTNDATSSLTRIDQLYTSLLAYRAGQGTYVEPLIMPSSFPDSGAPLALLDDYDTLMSVSEGVVFTLWCLQFNKTTTFVVSQFQIVIVEFGMTFSNKGWNPPEPHIGIDINTVSSNTGNLSKLWITCNATGDNVRLAFWTYEELQVYVGKSSLSYHMDLKQALPQQVKIGFSASTRMPPEGHVINDWELNSTLVSDKCTKNNERHTLLIAIFAASFSVLILAVAICLMVLRKTMNRTVGHGSYTRNVSSINKDLERLIWPRRFAYEELAAATNGFANETRLGQGGTGQVYKGVIHHLGCDVAIKRIFAQFDHKHYEKIFINEVKIISRLIHRNVVQFIGWCHEQDECLLVYAFMLNNSLDTHLFGCGEALPWDFRYKIALGLASALHYLHEDAGQCVLHRDIKSANVLLDNDFNTKLGDFGIAKLVDSRWSTHAMEVVGTLGYIAPEYALYGKASKESDMFSFGVVALEIACGRRIYKDGEYHVPLFEWVWKLYISGNLLDAADERMNINYRQNEMECLLIVGLWCTHPNHKERPKAGQVMKVLQLEAPLPTLPVDMHVHNYSINISSTYATR